MKRRVAIIRVRGKVKVREDIEDTMRMLRLYRVNSCIIVTNTESIKGMIDKVKDYITWGEIDEGTFKMLMEKRGRIVGNKKLDEEYLKNKLKIGFDDFIKEFFEFKKELKNIPGMKMFFRLNPPSKGFDKKGIKKPFSLGGALGYRKDKINDLIKRMI